MSDTLYTIGDWLKLTQTGGKGSAIVTPSTNPHSMRDERNMTIQVSTTTEGSTGDNETVDIEVKSEGVGPKFEINDSNIIELSSTATSIEIPIVKNNCKYVRYKVNESNTTIIEDVDVRELWLQNSIRVLNWRGTNVTNSLIKISNNSDEIVDPGKSQLYENGYLGIHFLENTSRDNIKTLNFDIWGEKEFGSTDDKDKIGKKTINITQKALGISVKNIQGSSGDNILSKNDQSDTYNITIADAVHGFTIKGNSNSKGILIEQLDNTTWSYTVVPNTESSELIKYNSNTGHVVPDVGLEGGYYNFTIDFTNVYNSEDEAKKEYCSIKLVFLGDKEEDNKTINIIVKRPEHPEIPSEIKINYEIACRLVDLPGNKHVLYFGPNKSENTNDYLTLIVEAGTNTYVKNVNSKSITDVDEILKYWNYNTLVWKQVKKINDPGPTIELYNYYEELKSGTLPEITFKNYTAEYTISSSGMLDICEGNGIVD